MSQICTLPLQRNRDHRPIASAPSPDGHEKFGFVTVLAVWSVVGVFSVLLNLRVIDVKYKPEDAAGKATEQDDKT